jgi:hypothetical protein
MSGIDILQLSDKMQKFDALEASFKKSLDPAYAALKIIVDNDYLLEPRSKDGSEFTPISHHNFDEAIHELLGSPGWAVTKINQYLQREFGGEGISFSDWSNFLYPVPACLPDMSF